MNPSASALSAVDDTAVADYDLAVVGSGPAGMAAAIDAAERGLSVAVIDDQPLPGGQIYRQVGDPVLQDRNVLGPDYYYGESLVQRFCAATVDRIDRASVWEAGPRHLCLSRDGRSRRLGFKALLLATGAQERPVPFPGWTLPGVMTCGAAQIMLKTSGLAPSAPLVLAGSGPLLLLLACQLLRTGIQVEAVLETTPTAHYRDALRELGGALRGWRALAKGMGLLAELKRGGVKHLGGVSELRALADSEGKLDRISYRRRGREQRIACRTLLVHQGVVPNVQLSRAVGAEHHWDALQECWRPTLDSWGASSIDNLFIAGDGSGIGGALVAEKQGRLAALAIAARLQRISDQERDAEAAPIQREIHRELAIRPFLDRLYRPAQEFLRPADDTLVCRCEEVTAGEIRRIARGGCAGPNQAKAFSRAGMGPCQGRLCGLTVSQLIAEAREVPVADVGYYRVRSPIKPITLGELAAMATPAKELGAHDAKPAPAADAKH
ncbi:NAD(P)/FAD-dependent oxidoreductase [Motiliproteus sp. SC1-56]|uniref:FAD/NAD(P)-dependent oxidoreductase n=1 Tax=Motiliproteus sp. SC1-56 TaxID=2799565 RepID=UPI001A8D24CB|nr:NAD(P)/FAD-dependent oxidoreductase [Motiliproteus sp. SC1-56]